MTPTTTVQLGLRVPPALYAWLREQAGPRGLNALVIEILEEARRQSKAP